MALQTAVAYNFAPAIAGDLRGGQSSNTIDGKLAQGLIPPGVLVSQGTREDQCIVPSSAAMVTTTGLGVALSNVAVDPTFGAATPGTIYQIGAAVPYCKRGQVWVKPEASVTVGSSLVYVRITAYSGNTQLGSFRGDADTHASVDYATLLAAARWAAYDSTSGLALLDLNLPQY